MIMDCILCLRKIKIKADLNMSKHIIFFNNQGLSSNPCSSLMCVTFNPRFGRRRAPRPRPSPIARGPGPSVAPDQFSPLENGCDGSPTATQAPTNGVNGSARSSPLYISPGKNYCEFITL